MKKIKLNFLHVPIEWWLLAIVLFFLPFIPDEKMVRLKLQWLEIGIFVVFSVWVMKQCAAGRVRLKISRVYIPMALLIIYEIILYVVSAHRVMAGLELRRLILLAGICFLAGTVLENIKDQKKLVHAWLASAGIIAVYGILQYYGGFWIIQVPRMSRIMGTSGNPIFFAAYLITAVPIILSLIVMQTNTAVRWYLCAVLFAVMTAVVLTKTRAAYLAVAAGIALWFLLYEHIGGWETIQRLNQRKWIAFFIVAVVGFGFFYAGGWSYLTHIASRQQAHVLIWRDTCRMWLSAPLLGKGLGMFPVYFPDFASPELKSIWPQNQFIVNDAHNEYLQILAETGVIGLGLFIGILWFFFQAAWGNVLRRTADRESYHTALWTIGIMVSSCTLLIQNMFSVDMRFTISAAFLFLCIGMNTGLTGRTREYSWGSKVYLRWILCATAIGGLVLLGSALLKPYQMAREYKKQVDFFDQKVLEPAKTIEDLQVLAQRYPDRASVFEKLGWVYAKEKRWQEAITSYLRAVELNPGLTGVYNNLGNINFQIGKKKEALAYYQKALSIDDQLIDAHINAGILYYYEGNLRQSAEHMNIVIKQDPDNAKARHILQLIGE